MGVSGGGHAVAGRARLTRAWVAIAVAVSAPLAAGRATGAPAAAQEPGRRVVLTFDDLPANSFRPGLEAYRSVTGPLVEGLVRHGIPAIGFVNESKLYAEGASGLDGGAASGADGGAASGADGDATSTADRDAPDEARVALLRRWLEAGLELGNHTYSHPDLHSTPLDDFQRDVLAGERITRPLLAEAGRAPRFFRHPFLHTGRTLEIRDGLERFLEEHGYRVAPVTIDNQEWIFARAYDHARAREDGVLAARIADAYLEYMDEVFAYYEEQSRALLGYELPQILLLHANQLNADVIDELVATIAARGYSFIGLEEALEDPSYDRPDGYAGPAGITWLHRWALTEGKRGEFFAGEPEAPDFVNEVFRNPPP